MFEFCDHILGRHLTPAARLSAGIDVLDRMLTGLPAEKVLTTWARKNRYAGSKDRAAIRDIVFDIWRKRRSTAAFGGASDGRALVLGHLRQNEKDVANLFTGVGYAPEELTPHEQAYRADPSTWLEAVLCDVPDWLVPDLKADLSRDFEGVMQALRSRAKVFLRVNQQIATLSEVIETLAFDEIVAIRCDIAKNALEVIENPRKISKSSAFLSGAVELQDAASQAVIDDLDLPSSGRILDYCAGGGGKALAMAAQSHASIFAHDISSQRMRDLPGRAARAGVNIKTLETRQIANHGPFDLVLCDAPCSGSGAWRRVPDGKWSLTRERLDELRVLQAEILRDASKHVAPNGLLAYATCSILTQENQKQVDRFLSKASEFVLVQSHSYSVLDGADGMFAALLKRKA